MDRQALRALLKAWRTIGWMKKSGPGKAAHNKQLEQMSQLELAVAASNPDHADDARAAAENELQGRGGHIGEIIPVMPGFVKPVEPERLRRKFFGFSRWMRKWMGFLSIAGFIVAIFVVGYGEEQRGPVLREALDLGLITQTEYVQSGRGLSDEEYDAAEAAGVDFDSAFPSDATLEEVLLHRVIDQTPSGRKYRAWRSAGYAIVALFVFAWFAWMLFSFLRGQPARVLLLRKFNDKKLAKAMEYVITDELRPFGHISTLSDQFIRRSRWGWIGRLIPTNFVHAALIVVWMPLRLILRQFNRARHGPPYVGSARDFRNLAKRLRDRIGLNIEVAMTSKEAFIVRAHDKWWKEVVALLMGSADIIVVDLSNVTTGTLWELERLDRLDMFEHAVFIAHEDRMADARSAAERFPGAAMKHIHSYNEVGDMADREAFRQAMLDTMSFTLRDKSGETMVRAD